jgi:potassium-transporting ATPase KdpC subunit
MKILLSELRRALIATITLVVIVCGAYPLFVWAVAQGLFPSQANGSLLIEDGKVIGSALIAQNFTDPKYFHPRPSAAGDDGYDAANSSGSNFGPLSKKLIESVEQRLAVYRKENDLAPTDLVPADAVTASASGLDPHISVKNARLQAHRVAKNRGMDEKAVIAKIEAHAEGRVLGIFGEPRVNVMKLNLALD